MSNKICYRLEEQVYEELDPLLNWLPCLASEAGIDIPSLLVRAQGSEPRLLKAPTSDREEYEVFLDVFVTAQGHDADLEALIRSFVPEVWPPLKRTTRGLLTGDFPSWEISSFFYLHSRDVSDYDDNRGLTQTYTFKIGEGWNNE